VGANFVVRATDAGRLDACIGDLVRRLEAAGLATTPDGI
jgi:hypothetical protein